ncbi:MAG: FxLYD domain-containing protein [Thermomicrobiales bacterium]
MIDTMRQSLLRAILLLCTVLLVACGTHAGDSATRLPGAGMQTAGSEAVAGTKTPPTGATKVGSTDATGVPAPPQPTGIAISATSVPTAISGPEGTGTLTAPAPTSTLPPATGSLRIRQWGYSQSEAYTEVSWGFLISNQDRASAVLDTAYVLTFVDDTGQTIKVDEGYIDIIMPDAEIGVGGSTFLPQDAIARSMRVDLRPGRLAQPPIRPAIAVENIAYFERSLFPIATGVVSAVFDRPVEDVRVYAVGFDRNDAIVGGGSVFLPFILPGQPIGVEVSISGAGQPSRIELYPVITSATVHADEMALLNPRPAAVTIEKQGWGAVAASGEIGWAFLLQNPSDTLAAEPVFYQVTAWSADGRVLATNTSAIPVLLPGELLGVGGSVFAPDGVAPDRVDIQILDPSWEKLNATAGMLPVSNVQLVPDVLTPRATGVVTNGLDVDLGSVAVFAVGYDASGAIIGGGLATIETLPARGEATVDVALAVGGEPARVELYAALSSSSQIP